MPKLEGQILVEQHKAGDCGICVLMYGMSASESSQKPPGLLQPLEILEWKWEHITMDFVLGLPGTSRGNNTIWVIVDHLTKSANFIPMRTGKKMHMLPLVELFVNEIVSRHGQLVSITSDRDSRFVSRFACVHGYEVTVQHGLSPTNR